MTALKRIGLVLVLYALATLGAVWLVPPGGFQWAVDMALFLAFAGYLAGLARAQHACV